MVVVSTKTNRNYRYVTIELVKNKIWVDFMNRNNVQTMLFSKAKIPSFSRRGTLGPFLAGGWFP